MNYQHDQLIKRITSMDERPKDQKTYAEWIKAEAHLALLRDNALETELIIHACDGSTFINTVAVDEDRVSGSNLDVEDLLAWSGNPFYSSVASYVWGGGRNDVWIERGSSIRDSETLAKARDLIFGRTRHDRPTGSTSYFEVAQEYAHSSDIHFYPEHGDYCRYDDRGDLEHVVTVTARSEPARMNLVTFRWEQLEQYLAASRCVLIRMFDFALFDPYTFKAWPDTPEDVTKNQDMFYRQKVDEGRAAYTRGAQVIRPRKPRQKIFQTMKDLHLSGDYEDAHVEFLAYDYDKHRLANISTHRMATKTYFSPDDDLPHELSPAFFNTEVLSRFKADTDKYVIQSRKIHCRGAWELDYDINAAGQVHAYICDLRNLPHREQEYWKSFNERPKANISQRAIRNDFMGQWVEITDPLERIKRLLRKWNEGKVAWWHLRDAAAEERVTLPVTGSTDEWANAFKNLSILVIEGFSEHAIRTTLAERQIKSDLKQDRSIALLEKLAAANITGTATRKMEGLRSAQRIRNKVDAHARGDEAEQLVANAKGAFGSLNGHFESVCEQIIVDLEAIEEAFCS